MKKIALIEDDARLLKRMSSFLNNQNGWVCTIAVNSLGDFFERLDEEAKPDLLLLDIELAQDINTIVHLQKIKNLVPHIKVLVITGHNHPEYVLKALQEGADSFYLKGSGLPKLVEAIEATVSGGAYIAPEAAAHMIPFLRKERAPSESGVPHREKPEAAPSEWINKMDLGLSIRERQVVQGLISGQSYREIAQNINLSVNTVRHYVKVLYKKFDVANKVQLSNKLKL